MAYGWFPDKYDEFQILNLGSSVNGELDYGTLPDVKPLTQGMIPALAKLMKDQEKEYREVLVMDRAGREYYIGTLLGHRCFDVCHRQRIPNGGGFFV